MRKNTTSMIAGAIGAGLSMGVSVACHASHPQISSIALGGDVRAESLSGDGGRAELSLWRDWVEGNPDAVPLYASIGMEGGLFAAAESSVVRLEGSAFFATLEAAVEARAALPDFATASSGSLPLAADASAIGSARVDCLFESEGWLRVSGTGSGLATIGGGRSESAVAVIVFDASGGAVAEEIEEVLAGSWSVAIDVPAAPGSYSVYLEWRGDALAESLVGSSTARVEGTLSVHALPGSPPRCLGDADANGVVNFNDLVQVLAYYGFDYGGVTAAGDSNLDGCVDFRDITATLATISSVCP